MTDRILILDFGSQVTQLIARRVRENGVYCEIRPYTASADRIRDFAPARHHPVRRPGLGDRAPTRRARPISCSGSACRCSAICYGMQTLCAQLGGRVTLSEHQEFGRAFIDVTGECRLFEGLWPPGRARAGLDEPRRQGRCAAARLPRRGVERGRALCRGRRRRAPVLRRRCSTPRSCTRRRAAGCCGNFTHRVCGCRRRLDDGGVPRPGDRADPRPGRHAAA